jgi:gamma-carbonic anhydrase
MASTRLGPSQIRGKGLMITPFGGKTPSVDASVFLAEGAMLIGDVKIGGESSIWFNAVVRGDINRIRIGERTNIQDLSVLHVTHEHPVEIGSRVTVGHRAIVHGAAIGDCCLIGMGATILDGVRIGSYSLIAAGAVVLQHTTIPEGVLVAGVPASVRRPLTDEERKSLEESATRYVGYARSYQNNPG